MDNFVTIRDLHFSRRDNPIFKGVDIDIPRGKITAIMGPSGVGKTTLLELIGGQLYPSKGFVNVDGQNVHELSRKELYQLRNKMGMLFQAGGLFTNITVFENVAFPIREHTDLNESMIRDLVLMKLEAVGLRGARHLMPSQLSGGMARRVALARALALDPEIIMYDEPFTAQDPISKGILVKLIKFLNQTLGMTSVIVSHNVPETVGISDYIYIVVSGKIVGQGTRHELSKTRVSDVRQFLEGLPDGPVPFHYPCIDFDEDLLGRQ